MSEPGRHWLDEERLRVYPRIFVGVYAVALIAYLATQQNGLDFRGQVMGSDFVTFYAASRLVLAGNPADVFDHPTLVAMQQSIFPAYSGGGFAWFYPPTFLLLITPLGLMPYPVAFGTFVAGTFAAWLVAVRRAVGRPGAGWLIAAFPGLWICLAQGQMRLADSSARGWRDPPAPPPPGGLRCPARSAHHQAASGRALRRCW